MCKEGVFRRLDSVGVALERDVKVVDELGGVIGSSNEEVRLSWWLVLMAGR